MDNKNNNVENVQSSTTSGNADNHGTETLANKSSKPSDSADTSEKAVKHEMEHNQMNTSIIYDLTKGDGLDYVDEAAAFRAFRVAGSMVPGLESSRGIYRSGRYMGVGGADFSGYGHRSEEYYIAQKLRNIGGPTLELEPIENGQEQKFSVRNRMYVGNLSSDVNKNEDIIEMFKPYGEIFDIFLNKEKNFAFLKVDWHANGEKAKLALDGTVVNGRQLRVRFASGTSILRVSNLSHFVSNELLYKAFEIFGTVERAVIKVNDRGHHLGEGVVEFTKKSSASNCLRFCHNRCYLLTASIRPCLVEPMEHNEDSDGMPEKAFTKNALYFQERSVGPRFASPGSVDHEYGSRWKDLHALYNTKQAALKREFKMEEQKLKAHLEFMRSERETELLREELKKREANNEYIRLQLEFQQKQYQEMDMYRNEASHYANSMQNVMMPNDASFRRRQFEMPKFMPDTSISTIGSRPFEGPNPFDVFGDKVKDPILNNVPICLPGQSGNYIEKNMMEDMGNPINTSLAMGRRHYT